MILDFGGQPCDQDIQIPASPSSIIGNLSGSFCIEKVRKDNSNWFSYEYNGIQVPVVRDADFFIMHSLLNYIESTIPFEGILSEARKFKEKLNTIFKNQETKSIITGFEFGKYDSTLIQEIDNFFSVEFFEKLWFDNQGYNEFHDSLLEAVNYSAFKDENVSRLIKFEKERLASEFSNSLEKYRVLKALLSELTNFQNYIRNNFITINNNFDFVKEFGLVRFSIQSSSQRQVLQIMQDLILANEEQNKDDFKQNLSYIVNQIYAGVFSESHEKLEVGLSVLWIFEKYRLIEELCDNLNFKYPSYSTALIHASASFFNRIPSKKKIEKIILSIEEKNTNNYKVWIGLAYIYFRIWSTFTEQPFLPNHHTSDTEKISPENSKEYTEYFNKAIDNLSKSITFLSEHRLQVESKAIERNRKYYYAINNYIYYSTKGSSRIEFENLTPLIQKLEEARAIPDIWQARFDDTLAYYHLRKCYLASKGEMFKFHINKSQLHNEESLKRINLPRDKFLYSRVRDFIEELKLYGFEHINKNNTL